MCRSNDIIWGCYGANAVHMSMLHEYLAGHIGVPVGVYTQISFDWHTYLETPYKFEESFLPLDFDEDIDWTDDDVDWVNNYETADDGERNIVVHPLVADMQTFDPELKAFMTAVRKERSVRELDTTAFNNSFFTHVAIPMHLAWEYHKLKDTTRALDVLRAAQAWYSNDNDWLYAGERWLESRAEAAAKKRHYDSTALPTQHGSVIV
jgi:hypothetical protein